MPLSFPIAFINPSMFIGRVGHCLVMASDSGLYATGNLKQEGGEEETEESRTKHIFFFQVKWQLNNEVVVTHKPVSYPASVQWSGLGTIRQFHRCRKPVQPLSRQKLIRNHYSH